MYINPPQTHTLMNTHIILPKPIPCCWGLLESNEAKLVFVKMPTLHLKQTKLLGMHWR